MLAPGIPAQIDLKLSLLRGGKKRRKKMRVLNMLLKIRAVAVFFFFLMSILPAREAIRVPHGEKQIMMKNYKDQFFGSVQKGQVPPYVLKPSPMMSQKALFVTDHNVDVSPLTRSLLSRGDVPPSAPNPPSWTPSKSHRAPPSLGP